MDIQLEEGELSDTSEEEDINPYIPLERPVLQYEQPAHHTDSDMPAMEEDATSSNIKPPKLLNSDSETDDEANYSKKLKLSEPIKNKYSVWNKDPDGDLTDILNQVGIMEKPSPERCRNVENYPLPFDKRSTHDFTDTNLCYKKRKIPSKFKGSDQKNVNFPKIVRNLDPLDVGVSNTIEEVAEDITKKLKECNEQLILNIVIVLGKDKAIELYEKTKVIEKLGGMPILNGTRKRTSGGVFIFLVRSDKDLSEDKLTAIFEKDLPEQKKIRRVMNKIRRKQKGKHSKPSKSKEIASELSNPPPSPNLPDLPLRKDLLTELASLDQQKSICELQPIKDDGFLINEEIEFPDAN